MDELLTKENLEYRAMAREIADKFVRPVAAELDRTAEYPWTVVRALQDIGEKLTAKLNAIDSPTYPQ